MEIKEEITTIIRNRLKLPEKASRFTDIRHTPQIPLRTIILCFALMPFYGVKSLLRLDFLSRKGCFKNLPTLFGLLSRLADFLEISVLA